MTTNLQQHNAYAVGNTQGKVQGNLGAGGVKTNTGIIGPYQVNPANPKNDPGQTITKQGGGDSLAEIFITQSAPESSSISLGPYDPITPPEYRTSLNSEELAGILGQAKDMADMGYDQSIEDILAAVVANKAMEERNIKGSKGDYHQAMRDTTGAAANAGVRLSDQANTMGRYESGQRSGGVVKIESSGVKAVGELNNALGMRIKEIREMTAARDSELHRLKASTEKEKGLYQAVTQYNLETEMINRNLQVARMGFEDKLASAQDYRQYQELSLHYAAFNEQSQQNAWERSMAERQLGLQASQVKAQNAQIRNQIANMNSDIANRKIQSFQLPDGKRIDIDVTNMTPGEFANMGRFLLDMKETSTVGNTLSPISSEAIRRDMEEGIRGGWGYQDATRYINSNKIDYRAMGYDDDYLNQIFNPHFHNLVSQIGINR